MGLPVADYKANDAILNACNFFEVDEDIAGRLDHRQIDVLCGVSLAGVGPASTRRDIFASSMRWIQKVHFSMTPRMRTVTFGFLDIWRLSAMPFLARGPQ